MANKILFQKKAAPAKNNAGGPAYKMNAKHALAQYAVMSFFGDTYYCTPENQIDTILDLLAMNEPEFIAKTAIYARTKNKMKDTPALMLAYLSKRDVGLMKRIFNKVIDDGRMIRNFVQIMRSGQIG